jgi:hypothetical protein
MLSAGGGGGDGAAAAAAAARAGEFLDCGLSRVFARAGFGRWSLPGGCSDPPVPFVIERAPPPRALGAGAGVGAGAGRPFADGVLGVARLYTRSAGDFGAIDAAVQALVAANDGSADAGASAGNGGDAAPAAVDVR